MSAAGQRGSALVIALLVTFILSLLGISFLIMAQTESRIAHNERVKLQAFYAAEAGVRAVKAWFDSPDTALLVPTSDEVDRSLRRILNENDPFGPTDGLATDPKYKEGTGDPGDVSDDQLFERPYRGSEEDALMGRREFPDLRIDIDGAQAEADFLRSLSDQLLGGPEPGVAYRARISRIDVYAPPYVFQGTSRTRYGAASVDVSARIYALDEQGDDSEVLAEQMIRTVLNELPYSTPVFGPLHTCADLTVIGSRSLNAHWGAVTAQGNITLSDQTSDTAMSIPRQVPPGPRLERLWNSNDPAVVSAWQSANDLALVDDPWLRVISLQDITGPPTSSPGSQQPWSASSPSSAPPQDHSNLIQQHPLVSCPGYDYRFWKNVASSGGPGVFYYMYDEPTGRFRLNGIGDPLTFEQITYNRDGVFFFDTKDGRPPHDDELDGVFENLTDPIEVTGIWNARGFIYLNARELTLRDVSPGRTESFLAPGEPRVLIDSTDVWVDLGYPTSLEGNFTIGPAGDPAHNDRGPTIEETADFSGILFTAGSVKALGLGRYYGSVIAQGLPGITGQAQRGITLGADGYEVPDFYWDATIGRAWPPSHILIPRVTITRWSEGL